MTLQTDAPMHTSHTCSAFIPCRFEKCQTRLSASPPSSSGWTSRDHSCSCSGASLLTMTWISVQTPQPESPSVARWTVTPAVPSSPLAFPSRYSQPSSCRKEREKVSTFQPGDVGGSPGPWPWRDILPEQAKGSDCSL